jgi:hypothetical protein
MSDSTDTCAPIQVALIGHSFIARLDNYMRSHSNLRNMNLQSDKFSVIVRARGGLRTCHLARSSSMLAFDTIPDLCFLQLGENDIRNLAVEHVIRNILSIASFLRDGIGIRSVVIGQLLRRQPWASSPDFNDKVIQINIQLQQRIVSHTGIHFWRHRGFWSNLSFLGADGVHLRCPREMCRSSPMHKFWRNIRSAIIHHGARLRPVDEYQFN